MTVENAVFISYSYQDSELARKIAADLMGRGVSVWIDSIDIQVGDSLVEKINEGIRQAGHVLFLITKNSIKSEWVKREMSQAFAHHADNAERVVIPVVLGDVEIPAFLQDIRYADLSVSYERGLEEIVRRIEMTSQTGVQVSPNEVLEVKNLAKEIAAEVAQLIKVGPEGRKAEESPDEEGDPTLVFVIMSFAADMDPIFEGIQAAGRDYNLRVERVKDVPGDYRITDKILDMIRRARLIVADLTHERPNVYFELGYARGVGKTVITTVREGSAVHFDVQDWTYEKYSDSRILEEKLRKRFEIELGMQARADT